MRQITSHVVDGDSANNQLKIEVTDEPGQGGACHGYLVSGFQNGANPSRGGAEESDSLFVLFQNGPIKEFGVNGITQEVLLAIVIDRLECFQRGPFQCSDNADALQHCQDALDYLQQRTRARIARNVEGTHQK
jgi:hypothetical protein